MISLGCILRGEDGVALAHIPPITGRHRLKGVNLSRNSPRIAPSCGTFPPPVPRRLLDLRILVVYLIYESNVQDQCRFTSQLEAKDFLGLFWLKLASICRYIQVTSYGLGI